METIKFVFEIPDTRQEHFIAELIDLDFHGFEQIGSRLIAYVEKTRFNDTSRESIEQLTASFPEASFLEMENVAEKNWNEVWEQSIRPQHIGSFLVKPTWADVVPEEGEVLLEIDPKMAFGTGYHATTRLMLRQFSRLGFQDKVVLDAGTGTGILAIAAAKCGARKVVGFDVDPWSIQNAEENKLLNHTGNVIEIREGDIGQVGEEEIFDIILANINRNVILDYLESFANRTADGGIICLSGLLYTDEEQVRDRLNRISAEVTDREQEEEWILLQLEKEG